MYSKNLCFTIVILFGAFSTSEQQTATVDLDFENVLLTHNGAGWPGSLKVVKGNDALMTLRIPLANQRKCTVTAPSGVQFDVKQPPQNRYQQWGDGCGIRVKNVVDEDEGRWRLTASSTNDSVVGWIELHVLDKTLQEEAPPISLHDGETHAKVVLSSVDNSYCLVAKPFAESSLVPGQCSVTLDRTTRAVQGNWQIFLGLPGRVSELETKRHVTVQTERLDVGYIHDVNDKLHIYCNILHTNKNISFCRFQRTSDQHGYNVVDGLSDGSYSYYGDGFDLKQCGITIEKPTTRDYATWRCSVGVQILVGNVVKQQTPMQALISVSSKRSRYLERNEDTTRKVFVQKDSPFTITCDAGMSLRYCWFQHPNGTQFTPVRLTSEEQLFWYTGESLEAGDCGITFAHSNTSDDGVWSCFMGPRQTMGIEIKDQVEVRVTGPLAANRREIPVILGENATLLCHTSNGRRALNYCRFLSPQFVGMSIDSSVTPEKEIPVVLGENATLLCHTSNGRRALNYCRFLSPQFVGMNIDSSVTPENAILDRFYFTPGRDLNVGDCSLSISSVQEEDIGEWTCAAVVDDEILESRDTIKVYVSATRRPRLQAGIIGAGAGVAVLVVVLVGYIAHKRGWARRLLARSNTTPHDAMSYSAAAESVRSSSLGSANSGSSDEAPRPRLHITL